MSVTTMGEAAIGPDWELDYYSRPVLESDGKKRWELLICSTPAVGSNGKPVGAVFQWVQPCPASSVNSLWLRQALEQALTAAQEAGFAPPRRLRCWRASMRTMVQRAAEGLGLELVPSRRTYALVNWLQQREREVYPAEEGYMAGPLAPPARPILAVPVPLPEAARGESWCWASLPVQALSAASEWEAGFASLVPLPPGLEPEATVPGIRLFGAGRALAIAGWISGLEPVRLEVDGTQLVLEAGLEDRWLLGSLDQDEARAASQAFRSAREQAGGLQFLAVQASDSDQHFEGFWLLRDLPDA